MRVALAALAVCLVLPVLAAPGGAVAASGLTSTAIGPTGYYWPVNRIRALDSRISGSIPAGATAKVRVTGPGRLPTTSVAASVNLTVLTPAVAGSLSAFADGTSFSGATMSFQAGQTNQNFETVPVSATGVIDIRNNTTRPLALIVDILGYHTTQTLGDHYYGWYQPMTPTRLLDTRTDQPVAAGQTRTFQVTGRAGIPPRQTYDEVAVVVNFTVLTPSRTGSLSVSTDIDRQAANISFAAGQTEQDQLLVIPDSGGSLPIRNNSGAAIQVIADVVGYYTGADVFDPQNFDHLEVGGGDRVYDSRVARDGPVPPGGTVKVPMPPDSDSGICAPLLNLTVLTPSTAGSISAWPAGTPWDGTATVSFAAHHTRQRQLMVLSPRADNVPIRNNSSAPITLIVDLDGWRSCD